MATGLAVQQTTWPAAPPFTNPLCPPLATTPDWSNSPDPASACNCGFDPCIVVSGPMEVFLGAELAKASCSLATRESNGYNSLDREPVPPALHPPSPTVQRPPYLTLAPLWRERRITNSARGCTATRRSSTSASPTGNHCLGASAAVCAQYGQPLMANIWGIWGVDDPWV